MRKFCFFFLALPTSPNEIFFHVSVALRAFGGEDNPTEIKANCTCVPILVWNPYDSCSCLDIIWIWVVFSVWVVAVQGKRLYIYGKRCEHSGWTPVVLWIVWHGWYLIDACKCGYRFGCWKKFYFIPKHHRWRRDEKRLFSWTIIGGYIGTCLFDNRPRWYILCHEYLFNHLT